MKLKPDELSCYAAALTAVHRSRGTLADLPPGALHRVGGLRPDTAQHVESLIRALAEHGEPDPTIARVMAEIDLVIVPKADSAPPGPA